MKLFLMRHGEAESFADSDEVRALTERGVLQVANAAELLPERLDRVWVSPYLRARQSCQQIADRRPQFPDAEEKDFLTPDRAPQEVIEHLLPLADKVEAMLLVFHQPIIGELAQLLVDNNNGYGLSVPTSGLVLIEADVPAAGCGTLVWMKDGTAV